MSVHNVYIDDGKTETEEFTILKKCLECEIEHYHDITKAKLVSTFFHAILKPINLYLTVLLVVWNWCSYPQFFHADIHAFILWEALFCVLHQPHPQSH